MSERVLPPVRRPFRAMAEAFVPEAEALGAEPWARAEAAVESSLVGRSDEMKRQLVLFIRMANWAAVGRYGRPLTGLDRERRAAFLELLEKAPVLLVRRGVWGVRSLSFMAYYGLPEVRAAIGYRAHPAGWDAPGRAAPGRREADRGGQAVAAAEGARDAAEAGAVIPGPDGP